MSIENNVTSEHLFNKYLKSFVSKLFSVILNFLKALLKNKIQTNVLVLHIQEFQVAFDYCCTKL